MLGKRYTMSRPQLVEPRQPLCQPFGLEWPASGHAFPYPGLPMGQSNGFVIMTPANTKSLLFLVATGRRYRLAVAAIKLSLMGMA